MMKKTISIFALLAAIIPAASQPVTYEQFIALVAENNTLYIAEKYNVDIASASLQAARVFNDPELSVSYGNNQDWDLQMGQSVEAGISINPDFAGMRRARIAVSDTEKDITEASVMAFLSNLKFEAASAWAQAWKLRESCAVMKETVGDMMQIASSDSLRLRVGDIGRADALQSRLEAGKMKGELLAMEAEYANALDALSLLCGGKAVSALEGNLPSCGIVPSVEQVCSLAQANRSDLKAAMLSKTLSENNLKLLKASRAFEMGIDLGYSYNTEVRNEIAPAPRFNGLTIGVSIPLKFSAFNKGEVNAARARVRQSEKYCEAACLQVRFEAIQAYNTLNAAISAQNQYTSSILDDARSIVASHKQGYLQGESSLLEYLSARQTYLDVMQAYINACSDCFVSRARLEKAIGK